KSAAKNFAKGWIAAEAVQFLDDRLDRNIFGAGHNDYFKSLVLPATILTPGGFVKKTLAGLGTAFVGHAIDKFLPSSENPGWGRFMRPSGMETAAVSAALFLPMRTESLMARSLMVGGAWLGSKVINYAFSGKTAEEKRDDGVAAWVK